MKIIVLEGSPNKHGSSNMLADSFIRGAEEAGCGSPSMTERSPYIRQAYELGKGLK